jgi:hypothetical protein
MQGDAQPQTLPDITAGEPAMHTFVPEQSASRDQHKIKPQRCVTEHSPVVQQDDHRQEQRHLEPHAWRDAKRTNRFVHTSGLLEDCSVKVRYRPPWPEAEGGRHESTCACFEFDQLVNHAARQSMIT